MIAIYNLLTSIIDIYVFLLIMSIVLSWLVIFNVVNTQNKFVYMIGDFLHRITEPVLGPIRRFLPNMGNLDLSPIVLVLGLYFVRDLLREVLF